MHRRGQVPRTLLILAGEQSGILTREQALDGGMSAGQVRGLVTKGPWVRLTQGVFSLCEPAWEQWAAAGVVIGGPGSSVGGMAAAHLHRLAPEPDTIDIWAPRGSTHRQRTSPHPWDFHRGTRSAIGRPPHLTVEEMVLDLCSASNVDGINGWLARVLSDRRTTPDRLREAIRRVPTLRNRRLILECLDVVSTGAHSSLEVRYLRDVEKAHQLPRGVRQKSLLPGTYSDVFYELFGLIVELDGRLGHTGAGEIRDSWRDSAQLLAGVLTIRFGWSDVTQRPCQVAARVAGVLRTKGWQGELALCPSCST